MGQDFAFSMLKKYTSPKNTPPPPVVAIVTNMSYGDEGEGGGEEGKNKK